MPVFFMLLGSQVTIASLLDDDAFRVGLLLQAIAAFWSGAGLYRALRTQTPDQLRLKRRFALVFLRWLVMVMVTYTGIVFLFGRFGALIFVAIYAAVSIVIDVAPDRFLRAMPGGAEDADPLPGASPSGAPAAKIGARKHSHKR
jgi:Kef-type K+ transport system membrane component KefB